MDHVLIGKIVGAHGIRGNIKIISFAESLEIFEKDRQIVLRGPDNGLRQSTVNWVKPHGRKALMSVAGVTSRDMAEDIIGWELYIEKGRLPQLGDGVYYWSDLIGLKVVTPDGSYLGRIESVIQTGSNDVYVVRDDERETLIPALEQVVTAVDLINKKMQVELPEGL